MVNKKGVSGVITTVLMILLVIAAIGILWLFVSDFLETGLDSTSSVTECIQLDMDVVSAVIVADVPAAGDNTLEVTVKRNSGDVDLTELRFLVVSDETQQISMTPTTIPGVAETTKYSLKLSAIDQEATVEDLVRVVAYTEDGTCGVPAESAIS